jgi:S-ribosylhomocysteine lyase
MGCRTGFYLILEGVHKSRDVLPLLDELFDWIAGFEGEIPGARPNECGNYSEQNLNMAKWEAAHYAKVIKNPSNENLEYPPLGTR